MTCDIKIKRFITCLIPVYSCNFRCHYCYLSHHKEAYSKGIKDFVISPQNIAKSMSVENMGGSCYFNLCASGETLFHPQIIELIECLTNEGHVCDVVTNGMNREKLLLLTERLSDIQKEHFFVKFSLHYIELKKRNMLAEFAENVNIIKNGGISYSIEVTPNDELIPLIHELKIYCLENFKALPHITVARNECTPQIELLSKYGQEEYKDIWSSFESPLFDFKLSIFGQKRKEFCYAGLWSLWVNLETGYYSQCYKGDRLGNIKEIDKPIMFRPIGRCRQPHCFNGHAFLALGDIPSINGPTYYEERDREMKGGNHWFSEWLKIFFDGKLSDNNEILSRKKEKMIVCIGPFFRTINVIKKIKDKLIDKTFEWF